MSGLLKSGLMVSVLALSACGNSGNESLAGRFVKAGMSKISNKAGTTPAAQPTSVRAALKASKKPVAILLPEGTKSPTLLEEVERNGPYRTYFTAGAQSVTFRNGFVTGTRGLGHDLMATSWGRTQALISAKQEGKGRKTLHYLTGEGRTVALQFECDISRAGTEHMTSGELNVRTQVMEESCQGNGYAFENGYQVAPSGMVVSSRQWMGPITGYVAIDQLRL